MPSSYLELLARVAMTFALKVGVLVFEELETSSAVGPALSNQQPVGSSAGFDVVSSQGPLVPLVVSVVAGPS